MRFLLTRSRSSSKGTTSQSTISHSLHRNFRLSNERPCPLTLARSLAMKYPTFPHCAAHHPHHMPWQAAYPIVFIVLVIRTK
jgi:hypothetical protein